MKTMKGIQHKFKLKDDKIAEPDNYLGTGLSKMMTENGRECWSMSPEKYCKAAVLKAEQMLSKDGKILLTKCKTPLKSGYCPELGVSQELKSDGVQYYMELIGVLRWAVDIGRVDILYETSIMSTHLALPIVGHLEHLFHVFGYLKENPKWKIAFDPDNWFIDYQRNKKAIPGNMPPPRGNGVTTHCFEDTDLAGNT